MDDMISRQAAIDALKYNQDVYSHNFHDDPIDKYTTAIIAADIDTLVKLPSAQPERLTDDDFETIRIHLNAYKEKLCNQHRWKEAEEYQRIIDRFMAFASAQPDLNKWCTDCKEYDKEKHCCPRFNRVIREALKDAEAKQYTKEELKIFLHCLSLRLLSLRSAQHWQEDDETAKKIEFLAHLYEKVEADLEGKT